MKTTVPNEPIKILLILQDPGNISLSSTLLAEIHYSLSHLHYVYLFYMPGTDLNAFIHIISLNPHRHQHSLDIVPSYSHHFAPGPSIDKCSAYRNLLLLLTQEK